MDADLPLDPLPGSAAPTTVMPSALGVAAARTAPSLEAWMEAFRVQLTSCPELVQPLLVCFRDGQVELGPSTGLADLERVGAVTVTDGLVRLTPLGVRGLFTRGRLADPSSWLLDPGEWWANLSVEDLTAFLEAAAQLRLVDQGRTVQRWFDHAPPLAFAFQLVLAGPIVKGAARNVAFGYLLRIGLEAAPAVEEWLVIPAVAGWGRLWFDLIGAPRPGVPTDEERAFVSTDLNKSVDELTALLDRYAKAPPNPPLTEATIDELLYAVPFQIATIRVGRLLQRLLNPDLEEQPGDRAELAQILTEARDLPGS